MPFRVIALIPIVVVGLVVAFRKPKYGLLLFILIMIIRPQDDRPNLAMVHIPLLVLTVVMLGSFFHREQLKFRIGTEHVLLSVFVFALALSTFLSPHSPGMDDVEEFIVNGCAFFLITYHLKEERDFRIFLWVLLLSGLYFVYLAVASPSFMQENIGRDQFERLNLYRLNRNFGTTNYLAFFMGLCGMTGLAYFATEARYPYRLAALACAGGAFYVLMLARSRMATIGVGVSLLLFPILARRWRIYVFIGLAVAAVAVFSSASEGLFSRMATVTRYSDDASVTDRFVFWQKGWDFFTANPLFGIGLGGFEANVGQTPHNSFVQILAEGGAVSFTLFVLLFGKSFWSARRSLAKRDGEPAIRGAILAVFFFNLLLLFQSLSTGMAHREITFIIFGVTFALGNILEGRERPCAA